MNFTDWLTFEMRQRGWTQAELAIRSGVTPGAISHIFSGTRKPGIEMLRGIARALSLPNERVFRAAGALDDENTSSQDEPAPPPNLGEWIRLYSEADEETRELLIDLAHFFSQRSARQKKAGQIEIAQ